MRISAWGHSEGSVSLQKLTEKKIFSRYENGLEPQQLSCDDEVTGMKKENQNAESRLENKKGHSVGTSVMRFSL